MTKTNTSETSLAAYSKHAGGSFTNRELQAYNILVKYGEMTANECFEVYLKHTFPENYRHNTHARMATLRDEGMIFESTKRKCTITGETVIVWAVTPEGEVPVMKLKALETKLEDARAFVAKLEKQLEAMSHSGLNE